MAAYRRRDSGAPCEGHAHLGAVERERSDWATVKILAVLAVFIAFGLIFYVKDRELASSDGIATQRVSSPPTPSDPDARASPDNQQTVK